MLPLPKETSLVNPFQASNECFLILGDYWENDERNKDLRETWDEGTVAEKFRGSPACDHCKELLTNKPRQAWSRLVRHVSRQPTNRPLSHQCEFIYEWPLYILKRRWAKPPGFLARLLRPILVHTLHHSSEGSDVSDGYFM
uniref:WGS project CBMI000000000 data, contig CS3069_c004731 n=1 Tax=Fusarium clavum TaxID=2594811 RepID=A0A090N642_9HYPO|nr:unnamed protein product [Fusarium clavum]